MQQIQTGDQTAIDITDIESQSMNYSTGTTVMESTALLSWILLAIP